jgi:predicted Rossmann fold flavoprotein
MRIVIIGAGPSGLMCALEAAKNKDNQVTLLEKNEKAGRKIYITGKGRCNVTNNCSPQEVINNVVNNPKFLYSAINRFKPADTMNFFESRGVHLVTERGNRVFPESYKASDITKVLLDECNKYGVVLKLSQEVKVIFHDEGGGYTVKTTNNSYDCDVVVIATGGISYPLTGSTGDGYKFAAKYGHKIIDPVPALNAMRIKEKFPREAYKFTLKNVSLNVKCGKFSRNEFGELMLIDNVIDGPIVNTMSSLINRFNPNDVQMEIDFKPALNDETLYNRIKSDIEEMKHKANTNLFILLRGLIPSSLILMVCERMGANPNLPARQIDEKLIKTIIDTLKHFKLTYLGLDDIKMAIVTSGGVDTKEVDPRTFESKKVKNLYIIGELLDVDAFTGGFNMQIALATGYSCGQNLASNK